MTQRGIRTVSDHQVSINVFLPPQRQHPKETTTLSSWIRSGSEKELTLKTDPINTPHDFVPPPLVSISYFEMFNSTLSLFEGVNRLILLEMREKRPYSYRCDFRTQKGSPR